MRVSNPGFQRVFLPLLRISSTVVWEISNWAAMALWLRPWEWSLESSIGSTDTDGLPNCLPREARFELVAVNH